MVFSVSPLDQSTTVSSLLDQTANELAQDQNLTRIKKLLVYVCTGTWENNAQQLESVSLRMLLQQLFDLSTGFEQLQHRINEGVATLNKSAEYTIVANAVISRFSAVYIELHHGQATTASQAFYQAIAERLERDPRRNRIKKLLLLTCRGKWESSISKLDYIQFADLVRELHQIAPTIDSLWKTLHQVAQALSKPAEYAEVAEKITHLFESLYQDSITDELTELSELTQVTEVTHLKAATTEEICTIAGAQADHPITQVNQPQLFVPLPISPPEPAAEQVLRVLTIVQPSKVADLFNLRLEIMQDTNPLKAKILLFSLLHETFKWEADHDALLRTHELDHLLRILFVTHRLYSDVDKKLRLAAKTLGHQEYLQVAEAILRAIQPCYVETPVRQMVVPVSQASLTEITSMKAETCEITQPDRLAGLHNSAIYDDTTVEY